MAGPRWAILTSFAISVAGLPPTKINGTNCCSGSACLSGTKFNFPATTPAVTPRFDFTIDAHISNNADGGQPIFVADGSLGLPDHPLGVFEFNNTGPACGRQHAYIYDGVLAVLTFDFPSCPWQGDVHIPGHIDVWTTIPAVPVGPVGISTGFTLNLKVMPSTGHESLLTPDVLRVAIQAPGASSGILKTVRDHGWTTGDAVEYKQKGLLKKGEALTRDGGTAINESTLFYIAALSADSLKLFDNKEDAMSGTPAVALDDGTGSGSFLKKAKAPPAPPAPTPPPPPPAPKRPELLCAKVELNQPAGKGADPSQDVCTLDQAHPPPYPPPIPAKEDNITIPWVTVDLDADPKTRWTHIVQPLAKQIKELIDTFSDNLGGDTSPLIRAILDLGSEALLQKIPEPYASEIRGISSATHIDVAYIFIYNIMYEVAGLCTSVITQDAQGHVYHGRNLDFGLFDGSDNKTHNWALTPMLRNVLVNVKFVKSGKPLYNSTVYAGYVGLTTASKYGGFSLSIDSRFDANLDRFLILWLLGKYDGEFLSFKTRTVIENIDTYKDALYSLSNYKAMGPAYIIMGGAKSGEGAVIGLGAGRSTALTVRTLSDALSDSSFYVFQTNYDWGAPPPAFDDRRYPMQDCLNKVGSAGMNYETLWGIMSSNPNKNALTTFTTLMAAETGHFEAYKQHCAPGPGCVPFLGMEEASTDLLI